MTKQTANPSIATNAASPEAVGTGIGIALQSESGAPTHIHVLPRGPEILGRDGRKWSMPNPEAVVAAFNASEPLLIDYEHASEGGVDGNARPAAGWIDGLELRADGIWAAVSWTPRGAEIVANREYRFVSPAFFFDRNTFEIFKLASVGLVHRPNLPLTALNRRNQSPENPMKTIIVALGLADAATSADCVTAINALKTDKQIALNAATNPPSPELYVPRAQHDATVTALNAANKKIADDEKVANEARVTTLIDDAVKAGKVAPAAKETFAELARNNYDATAAAINNMPVIIAPGEDTELNRDNPVNGDVKTLTDTQKAMCAQMGVPEADYLKAMA